MEGSVSDVSGYGRQGVARPRVARQEAGSDAPRNVSVNEAAPPIAEKVQGFNDIMNVDRPEELPFALRAAEGFVNRNFNNLSPEDARQIQVKLLTKFSELQAEPAYGALVNTLETIISGGETGQEVRAKTPVEVPVMSAETQQQLKDIEHLSEVVGDLEADMNKGNQGAMADIAAKYDRWEQKLKTLPAEQLTHPTVGKFNDQLTRLAGKVELYKLKNNPRFRN